MDEIDRALLTDSRLDVSPRLLANVMADVRAIARPARPAFPWHEFTLTLAVRAGFAAAAAVVFTEVDVSVFLPVARELAGAGAILGASLVAIHRPRL